MLSGVLKQSVVPVAPLIVSHAFSTHQSLPRGGAKQESLLSRFYRVPAPLRYFVSGNFGNLALFLTDHLVSALISPHFKGPWVHSTCFFTAYMLHVPAQHWFHALLVYGLESIATPAQYWQTLGGTYSALALAAVGSTAMNAVLMDWLQHKVLAFVLTLVTFSFFNYFVIGWVVARSEAVAAAKEKTM